MNRPNLHPVAQVKDGTQLFISTAYRGERIFACQLYSRDGAELRVISEPFEASTCREAQETACRCAIRLYSNAAIELKKPPYLIWSGLSISVQPDSRRRPATYHA